MFDAELGEGVDQCIGHRGQRADATGFARPLDAQGVGLGWHWVAFDLHVAEVMRVRHGVVHERGGDELSGAVEMDVFHQGLAGALGNATMDLAVQQQWIEHGAKIVDHTVACDLDFACLPVNLQFTDVTAVRIIIDGCIIDGRREQARFHAFRQIGEIERGSGNLLH